MQSIAVLLKGKLRGMGYEVACDLMAKRQAVSPDGRLVYSQITVLDAPRELPEGDYVAKLDCCSLAVRRRNGQWIVGNELLSGQDGACCGETAKPHLNHGIIRKIMALGKSRTQGPAGQGTP